MATPRREIVRMPDIPRRRSARQALASIPGPATTNTSPSINLPNITTTVHVHPRSRRYSMESWSPGPSPDELVIQSRGRRRTIVFSPDKESCRNNNIFRDRTPVKTPTKSQSTMILRNTPRKKLSLDDKDVEMEVVSKLERKCSNKQFLDDIANSLRGLSHDQLVKMIVDLVSMQEDNLLMPNDKLRDIILKKMPLADIQPLEEKLIFLRTNVYASMVSSNIDESAYNRAYVHLDNYEKAVKEQGHHLLQSQHWEAIINYVFTSWSITKDLPEWKNQGMQSTTQKCFQDLTELCIKALENGKFTSEMLTIYKQKLMSMIEDFSDINVCLQLIDEASMMN